MMNTKTIRLGALALLPLFGLAEGEVYEGYWESMTTGTGTYWWNAANWRDGIIPGRYAGKDGDGNIVTNGNYGATAYFGSKALSWGRCNPETFDAGWTQCRLISISNLVFYADDFPPTIGQSQYFWLYLEQGGGIYVRDTCTKAPTFGCRVAFDAITDARPLTFCNDAEGTVMKFEYSFDRRSAATVWTSPPLRYGGKGSIQIAGAQPSYNNCRFYTDLIFTYPGKLILTGTFGNTITIRTFDGYGKQTVQVNEGAKCRPDSGGDYDYQIVTRTDLDFTGEGMLLHNAYGSTPHDMQIAVFSGCTLNIGCIFTNGWPTTGFVLDGTYSHNSGVGGIMKVTGENVFRGPATIKGGAIFETASLGNAGEASPFGLGSEIKLASGGTVRYTGADDSTDRTITIGGNTTGVLEQRGSGTPNFAGPVSAAATSTLLLSNDTAVAAEYSGRLDGGSGAPNVTKRGSGEWILSGATIAANTVKAAEGTLSVSNPCALAASRLEVSKGATLALGLDAAEPEARPASLTVYGTGRVKACWLNSLPASGLSLPDGAVASAIMPNWSWADILAYANANPQSGWSALLADTSALADGTTFTLSDALVTGDGFAIGHEGGDTMNLVVPDAVAKPVALVAHEGTVRISGEGSLTLSRALATSVTTAGCGRIVFDGLAGGITLDDGDIQAGGMSESSPGGYGDLAFLNTAVSRPDGKVGTIRVGAYGKGVLVTDSDISVPINVGVASNTSTVQGEGTVCQTGGVVTASTGIYLGNYGTGCYRISGGKLLNIQKSRYMGHFGQGMLVQSGGEVEFPTESDAVNLSYYGGFVGYQTGGTCTIRKRVYFPNTGSGSGDYSSSYTVAGETAVTEITNGEAMYMAYGKRTNSDGPLKVALNLNGGEFRASAVGYYPTMTSDYSRVYVNFNGGKYASSSGSPFGTPGGYPSCPDRVTIFEDGARIDVSNAGAQLRVALSAPYGNSVVSVPLPEAITDRDFAAPPYIEIFDTEGEGDGATAFADVDMTTRRISRIIVTSPGWGYTKAVARFNIGKTVLGTSECTLGTVAGGGFTKGGTGTLTLMCTNTYAGATVVKNGTLKLGNDEVLPTNTFVSVEGGTLDLNNKAAHVAGISVTGGAVINGTVTLSGITFDAANPQPYSCNCPVAFTEGAEIVLSNVGGLGNDVKNVPIANFAGGVTGLPLEVVGLSEEEAKHWQVVTKEGRVYLSRLVGMMVTFR